MKNEKKINFLIVVEPAISIEKNCIIIYTRGLQHAKDQSWSFFLNQRKHF